MNGSLLVLSVLLFIAGVALGQAAPFGLRKICGRAVYADLLKDFLGSLGSDRPDEHRKDAAALGQIVEHLVELGGLILLRGQLEWRGLLDELVGASDQPPDAHQRSLNLV